MSRHYPLAVQDKILLLSDAAKSDPCNEGILEAIGDTYISSSNAVMAALIYGQAIECSPAMSLVRFKYGEALLMMNFIEGRENVREAWTLEPHNPIYAAELNRLMAFR